MNSETAAISATMPISRSCVILVSRIVARIWGRSGRDILSARSPPGGGADPLTFIEAGAAPNAAEPVRAARPV
jgi:hypothetical protein